MNTVFYLIVVIYIKYCVSLPVTLGYRQEKILDDINTNSTDYQVFVSNFLKVVCNNSDCEKNQTGICAVRKINETYEFKDFESACHLFVNNICTFSGNEFYMMNSSRCDMAAAEVTRRHYVESGVLLRQRTEPDNGNTMMTRRHYVESGVLLRQQSDPATGNTTRSGLRTSSISIRTYAVDFCPEWHRCAPLVCPNTYAPVCMILNQKMHSTTTRFYTFSSHCLMDQYYCEHYSEFAIVPGNQYPSIKVSPLEMTFCGADKYLKFAFAAKAASSMGHYGWLAGRDRYSKILEPWERRPGYG